MADRQSDIMKMAFAGFLVFLGLSFVVELQANQINVNTPQTEISNFFDNWIGKIQEIEETQYLIDNELCTNEEIQSGQCTPDVTTDSAQDSSLYDVVLGLLNVAKYLTKIIGIIPLAVFGAFYLNGPIQNIIANGGLNNNTFSFSVNISSDVHLNITRENDRTPTTEPMNLTLDGINLQSTQNKMIRDINHKAKTGKWANWRKI